MKKTFIKIALLCLVLMPFLSHAQNVGINDDGSTPAPSAMLDVKSNSKGFLAPRMTTAQRNAITNPEFGLIVFDTDKGAIMFFDGFKWQALSFANENNAPAQERSVAGQPGVDTIMASGISVAISGNYAVVGAPFYSSAGNSVKTMGTAYVYQKGANGWQQQARLVAADSAAGDLFGARVAISGDYIAIAAPGKAVGSNVNQGKAYIFKLNGSNWQQDTAFVNPTGTANDQLGLGYSANGGVGISGTTTGGPIVVIKDGYNIGSVKIYQKSGSTWSLLQTLSSNSSVDPGYYCSSISFSGDYMAIGSSKEEVTDGSNTYYQAGAAYIYVLGGGVWNLQQKITRIQPDAHFGYALSISGSRLAISAPDKPLGNGTSAGIFIYNRTGATWNYTDSVFLPQLPDTIQFAYNGPNTPYVYGVSVGLSGNNLIVGGSYGITLPPVGVGDAYIYQSPNLTSPFTLIKKTKASSPSPNLFGYAVSIDGSNAIIGDPGAPGNNMPFIGSVSFESIGQ